MSLLDWYDKDGKLITVEEFGRLREDPDYYRVGLTEIGPYTVSTVWLGLDHGFIEGRSPIIFETLVFTTSAWHADRSEEDHEPLHEIDGKRYSTLKEAMEGHVEMCLLIRATWDPDPPGGNSEAENGHSEA